VARIIGDVSQWKYVSYKGQLGVEDRKKLDLSVKAMYNDIILTENMPVVSPIWKLKLPLKI